MWFGVSSNSLLGYPYKFGSCPKENDANIQNSRSREMIFWSILFIRQSCKLYGQFVKIITRKNNYFLQIFNHKNSIWTWAPSVILISCFNSLKYSFLDIVASTIGCWKPCKEIKLWKNEFSKFYPSIFNRWFLGNYWSDFLCQKVKLVWNYSRPPGCRSSRPQRCSNASCNFWNLVLSGCQYSKNHWGREQFFYFVIFFYFYFNVGWTVKKK